MEKSSLKEKRAFILRAQVLLGIMIIAFIVFISAVVSVIDNFSLIALAVVIISAIVMNRIFVSKTIKKYVRIPIGDTKM